MFSNGAESRLIMINPCSPLFGEVIQFLSTLPETNSSRLKIGFLKRKQSYSNDPSSGAKMLVSGRVMLFQLGWNHHWNHQPVIHRWRELRCFGTGGTSDALWEVWFLNLREDSGREDSGRERSRFVKQVTAVYIYIMNMLYIINKCWRNVFAIEPWCFLFLIYFSTSTW